jgi:hypothetical protein
METLLHTNNP